MADQGYSLVKEVNDTTQTWRIKARVARLWEHCDERKGNELIRMHLVLVDEEGDGIHAYIPQGQVARFKPLVHEGRVYTLQYFEVSPVARPYRPTVHGFELRFASWTTIHEVAVVDAGFPIHYYTLSPFKDLMDNVTDKTYLADVIGLLTGISPMASVTAKGKPTAKRNLRVTDGRHTAVIALWGDKAKDVDEDALIQRSRREPVVVLAMGCGFRMQDGMLQVSPSFGSKVCYDVVSADVSAFRNRIIGLDHVVESIPDKGRQLAFSEMQNVSVGYLMSLIPHEHLNKVYKTRITIVEVPTAQNWWYRSCDRCNSAATEEGDMFRCSKENCTCKSASPRYKLGVKAEDDGSIVDMVFFGDIAADLIGKPADKLIVEFLDSDLLMPPEITRLVGRRYVVDVTVSRFSLRRERIDYQVLKFFPEGGDSYADFSLPGTASKSPGSGMDLRGVSIVAGPALAELPSHGSEGTSSLGKGSAAEEAAGSIPNKVDDPAALVALSTPPQNVLEVVEEEGEKDKALAGAKAMEVEKRKRVRPAGSKPSASKKLYADEQARRSDVPQ